jgi:hypothetical protein
MHVKILWFNSTDNLEENSAMIVDYIKLNQMNLSEGEWHDIDQTFVAPRGAKIANVWFGANRLRGYQGSSMYIDQVNFNQTEMTIGNASSLFSSLKTTNFAVNDPTSYSVDIDETSPSILALSQTYNPSWVCIIGNESIHSFPLYGIFNGFQISRTGPMHVVIKYEPQQAFQISVGISLGTLVICAVCFASFSFKQKKRLTKSNSINK